MLMSASIYEQRWNHVVFKEPPCKSSILLSIRNICSKQLHTEFTLSMQPCDFHLSSFDVSKDLNMLISILKFEVHLWLGWTESSSCRKKTCQEKRVFEWIWIIFLRFPCCVCWSLQKNKKTNKQKKRSKNALSGHCAVSRLSNWQKYLLEV